MVARFGLQVAVGWLLISRIQDFTHISGDLVEMAGRLGPAGTVDPNSYTWSLWCGGLRAALTWWLSIPEREFQERQKLQGFLWFHLRNPKHPFYCILLVKYISKSSSDSRTGEETLPLHGRSSKEYVSIFILPHHSSSLCLDYFYYSLPKHNEPLCCGTCHCYNCTFICVIIWSLSCSSTEM